MKVELIDTSASTVRNELMRMSQQMGGLTNGVVLNLIIMTDEADQYDAMRAATHAGREHPCQVIGIIAKDGHRPRRLDAEVTVGENMPGQMALLRIHGELNEHVDSVVTPLLVPDTPVVVWWPGKAPDAPAADALGMLGQRRITDAAATAAPHHRLLHLAAAYRPGDTDLAWARTTNWRSLLAATLDRPYAEMLEATVGAEADNPSADLIVACLTGTSRCIAGTSQSCWPRNCAGSILTRCTARRSPCWRPMSRQLPPTRRTRRIRSRPSLFRRS